ncbi:hypothetical protein MesoLjLa_66860 (plasmid) [Mesorhizobium sp. L-2-11]|nr:hypothetical protein MesoLjLa_66860 [Mesorhizobium sp. L-2-11]
MIADGVIDVYTPDYCIGLHLWSELPTGQLACHAEAVFASTDKLSWKIRGSGGHGAIPHLATDTVSALASLLQLNSVLVAREVNAMEAAVISVGSIACGKIHNVIPAEIDIGGTLRTQSNSVRDMLLRRLAEIARDLSSLYKVDITFDASGSIPPCISNPEVAGLVKESAQSLYGGDITFSEYRTMAGEDMAEFLARIKGCYFLCGCKDEAQGIVAPHHTPEFDIDERAMTIGAEVMAEAINRLARLPAAS